VKIALIDNGSLAASSHRALRAIASELGRLVGEEVDAVSWKHSDQIPSPELGGKPAWTLRTWVLAQLENGQSEFLFVPFFISAQGAIGSALRADLDSLNDTLVRCGKEGFKARFTAGPGAGPELGRFVAARVKAAAGRLGPSQPAVIVVDHGGPSRISAHLRDAIAREVTELLGPAGPPVVAASMESPDGPEFAFNRPLLNETLATPPFDDGDVIIAPLFLLPGRHAGPGGDLATIARSAESRKPGLRCHFTGLLGSHPGMPALLAESVRGALPRLISK